MTCKMLFTVFTLIVAVSHVVDATEAVPGLIDPLTQPLFQVLAPNPLDPAFVYEISPSTTGDGGEIEVSVGRGTALTGLVDPSDGTTPLVTPIWGYGIQDDSIGYTWPGRTFVWQSYQPLTVHWHNRIDKAAGYLLTGKDNSHLNEVGAIQTFNDFDFSTRPVVDDSFHWAYSLEGYEQFTIEAHGTPIVPHLHGGHSDAQYDGNPEYFFAPELGVKGPQFTNNTYVYDNTQPAATLWYHDHARTYQDSSSLHWSGCAGNDELSYVNCFLLSLLLLIRMLQLVSHVSMYTAAWLVFLHFARRTRHGQCGQSAPPSRLSVRNSARYSRSHVQGQWGALLSFIRWRAFLVGFFGRYFIW